MSKEQFLLDKVTNIVADRITTILDSVVNEQFVEDVSVVVTNKQLNDCIDLMDTLNMLRSSGYGITEPNVSSKFIDADKLNKLVNNMIGQ